MITHSVLDASVLDAVKTSDPESLQSPVVPSLPSHVVTARLAEVAVVDPVSSVIVTLVDDPAVSS